MIRRTKHNQLRKQPKRRRSTASSSASYPPVRVPDTARRRRRRQRTEGVRSGLSILKRIVFSSRWISLGLLVLTIYALVIIVQERRFYLDYIPVDGNMSFEREEIVAASELAGNHIFSANPSLAAANITALPGVISATVLLEWPNAVQIEIIEEQPVAVWQENGLAYGITGSGRLVPTGFPLTGLLQIIPESEEEAPASVSAAIEEADTALDADAMEIVDEMTEGEQTDDELAAEKSSDATAAVETEASADSDDNDEPENELDTSVAYVPQEVLNGALSLRQLRPSINELYYRPSGGLIYRDARGWQVYFGTGTDMNQKLVLYETILNDLLTRGQNPRYISVSNMSKPYYLAQ